MSDLNNEKEITKADELRDEGNHYARIENFESALSCYITSLTCRKQDKESLALTYAARSSVCFKCNEFEACLRNIQLAKDHNYPQNEIAVLNKRKSECLKLMETNYYNRENPWEFLKLSYPANNKVPFIVDCLELNTNDKNYKNGRHIITNEDLKVGDIVAIDKSFNTIPTGIRSDCCATCCTINLFDVIPCSTYVNVVYCSEACRELAMKTFYRTESKMICRIYGRKPMRMYMNALVLFGGSIEDLRDFLCANQSPPKTIFDLDFSNSDEIENDKIRLLAVFALIDDVDFTNKNIDQFATYFLECASEVFKKFTTTSSDISFEGLFLFDSLLNYSNTPNTVALQLGTKKLHLVIRPISKGEQLFKSYRPCNFVEKNGTETCSRTNYNNLCGRCIVEEELKKASGDLILHEPPKWPELCNKPLDRYSTVKLAIERSKNYCAMLQSSPDLLNNYNGVLITENILTCFDKVISNKPLSDSFVLRLS